MLFPLQIGVKWNLEKMGYAGFDSINLLLYLFIFWQFKKSLEGMRKYTAPSRRHSPQYWRPNFSTTAPDAAFPWISAWFPWSSRSARPPKFPPDSSGSAPWTHTPESAAALWWATRGCAASSGAFPTSSGGWARWRSSCANARSRTRRFGGQCR